MHAGNRDPVLQPHQFGQHLGALNHRNMQAPRFRDFGITHRDRGTGDHNIRAGDVRGGVSLENSRAQRGKSLRGGRIPQVGTGNLVAKVQQHFGNPTHADATNPHEMNALNLGEHTNADDRPFNR